MERTVFTQRLCEASARALDFARQFIAEPLPEAMQFRVRLNSSCDDHPLHEDECVYPEDSAVELGRRVSRCTHDEVVDVLWRDGAVPEWINLAVMGENGSATLVEVLSCGRFTANEELLYHQQEGRPPFHVLGPTLPVGFVNGQKFSIYDRSECWSRDELGPTARHAAKVWSLNLHGKDFDDEVIASLPVFERLHVLELNESTLNGRGLGELSRQPRLRHLRLHLNHDGPFTAAGLPKLRSLQSLTIANLPPGNSAAVAALAVEELSLSTEHELVLDARLHKALRRLTLRGRSIEGNPIPERLVSLRLHVRDARDADIERLLAGVKAVTDLSLQGTPVSEHFVESIVSRWKLDFLDVSDTLVGHDSVRRIRARHPKLRIQPNPDFEL